MYQPEDDFNFEESLKRLQNHQSDRNNQNENKDISAESVRVRKEQIEKIFLKLIAFGAGIGLVLGIIIFILLNKLGLSKKPYEMEQEPTKPNNHIEKIHDLNYSSRFKINKI